MDFSDESVKKRWEKESANESGSKFIPRFNRSYIEFVQPCFCFSNFEDSMNVFVMINFGSIIKLVSFDESQVVTFNSKFVCGIRNSDCKTGSQSDNTVGSPHGFIIHWIIISKNIKKVTEARACYECGDTGYVKKNCPKLKNHENGNENGVAQGRAYALGGGDSNSESNTVTGTFLLNNSYALILFDTGIDRSFVSTAFSALLNIAPIALDNHYDVELADGKIIGFNTILRGCTLDFLNHLFNIVLMPVPLGSFDVIIGMDGLTTYHRVIIYDEKIVRVLFEREMLIFQGNGNNQREESRLNIISCTKAQEYLSKGCDVFLAHITTKEAKDKSEGKRLEDVLILKDFPEGVGPVARVPYRLAQSEMKELADQLHPALHLGELLICQEERQIVSYVHRLSKTKQANENKEERLKLILELLKKEELYAKFSKCEFWIPKVQFLRHVIDSKCIHVDPEKIGTKGVGLCWGEWGNDCRSVWSSCEVVRNRESGAVSLVGILVVNSASNRGWKTGYCLGTKGVGLCWGEWGNDCRSVWSSGEV
nr:reverse transcriptase domain-containing protein [Tanacetum cinerariifolium]